MNNLIQGLLILIFSTVYVHDTSAQNRKISIQGILKDGSGAAVADGTYELTFRLYDQATGGNNVHTETHTDVEIRGGIYSVFLGSETVFSAAFDVPYFLSVQVASGIEMTPRTELSYAPYALAVGNSASSNVANTLKQNGTGTPMTFHWSSQSGQPSRVWGGNDGINHYNYNPSNFNVNSATTSTTAHRGNHLWDHHNGRDMEFAYYGVGGQPAWLWGTNNGTDNLVYDPSNFNVNSAVTSTTAHRGNHLWDHQNNRDMTFRYVGSDSQPTWIWGTNDGVNNQVYRLAEADMVVKSIRCTANSAAYTPYYAGQGSSYLNVDGVQGSGGFHPFNNGLSVNANGNMGALHFFAFSDRRIKTDINPSSPSANLDILNNLEVVEYRYKDHLQKGHDFTKGFIAQQVKEVFPEAVNMHTDKIPDVYAHSKSIVHSELTSLITMENDHGLKNGDLVNLIFSAEERDFVVVECPSASSFIIEQLDDEVEGVFVFGRRVDDFLSVDYDRIYTLSVSVIQHLSKQVSTLEEENEQLQNKLNTILASIDQLSERQTSLEQSMADKKTTKQSSYKTTEQ